MLPFQHKTTLTGGFFVLTEGLVCNRRQWNVITRQCVWHHRTVYFFGLITYATPVAITYTALPLIKIKKDTAHRINGLGRPVGIAQKNSILVNYIQQIIKCQ